VYEKHIKTKNIQQMIYSTDVHVRIIYKNIAYIVTDMPDIVEHYLKNDNIIFSVSYMNRQHKCTKLNNIIDNDVIIDVNHIFKNNIVNGISYYGDSDDYNDRNYDDDNDNDDDGIDFIKDDDNCNDQNVCNDDDEIDDDNSKIIINEEHEYDYDDNNFIIEYDDDDVNDDNDDNDENVNDAHVDGKMMANEKNDDCKQYEKNDYYVEKIEKYTFLNISLRYL
jgi:hypothetical protein